MFTGSVRDNLLGPRAEATCSSPVTDVVIWETLRRIGVADVVANITGGLDGTLGEQGGALSAGERALICLVRAVLRLELPPLPDALSAIPSVILADEPTASVDLRADAVVHDTLLTLPQTVLCICHRLHHVPRFDLVAVLNEGSCAEFGSPTALAMTQGSLYARLVASAAHEYESS